ncbi:MAG: hypothetical protein Q8T04_02950 [Bacteroidota bacterium]|nr:hypothetical protein [Bacteroidota bacterium]
MNPTLNVTGKDTETSKWFDTFVASIRVDEIKLKSGIASQEMKEFYKPLIENNFLEIAKNGRYAASVILIPFLITDYINGIKERDINLRSLSFQLSDSIILVWAVVNDDDEQAMDRLFLQEAEVNAKYKGHGFHISTTIMEVSDNCATPSHFQKYL